MSSMPQFVPAELSLEPSSATSAPLIWQPQSVPVWRVDSDLPALTPETIAPQAVRRQFARMHELVWTPDFLREPPLLSQKPPRLASVLIAITNEALPKVLLTQRTDHLSSHAGQIAFPGGAQDAADDSPVRAALREAQEEVGLNADDIEVLGTLPLYRTVTQFDVTPVVALIDPNATLQANPAEVADVFSVPLAFLMDPSNHRHHQVVRDGVARHWLSMPYEDPSLPQRPERFIWGATAAMLRNLYRFLVAH